MICEDCQINNCNDCYESDCDCSLSDHTVTPAQLIIDALAVVSPDPAIPDLQTGYLKAGNLTDGTSAFDLQINGRVYRVSVRAQSQGGE